MIDAIAKLPSDVELIALTDADSDWQKKLIRVGIKNLDSTYLVFPPTVESLSQLVKQTRQKYRILPCGSGSKLDWGGLNPKLDLVISTQKLDRIVEHAIGDLTVTVEAGVKLADLQTKLRETGQFLPIDPAYFQQATIGGIIATADTGSWRQRYGGIRDMLLGISFIRADGEIAKAGGRVVKNVAGYDLMKLFTGSYGTLGIITQATFRTYPLPEASQTILLTGEADKIDRASQILRSSSLTPTAADLISASVTQQLGMAKETGLILRFQTIPTSIEQQTNQINAIAKQLNLNLSSYLDRDEADLWQRLVEIIRIPASERAIICKIGIAPNRAVELYKNLPNDLVIIHNGSGLGILQLETEEIEKIQQLRSLCQEHRGFLTILTAPLAIKQQIDTWGYQNNALEVMKIIKQKFDPNHIFNPNRFVGGI